MFDDEPGAPADQADIAPCLAIVCEDQAVGIERDPRSIFQPHFTNFAKLALKLIVIPVRTRARVACHLSHAAVLAAGIQEAKIDGGRADNEAERQPNHLERLELGPADRKSTRLNSSH